MQMVWSRFLGLSAQPGYTPARQKKHLLFRDSWGFKWGSLSSLSALFHTSSSLPPPIFFSSQIWVFLSSSLKNLPTSVLPITCHFYATMWRGRLSFPPKSSVFQIVLMYIGPAGLLCLGRHSGLSSLLCYNPNSATFPCFTQAQTPWWLRHLLCLLMDSLYQKRISERDVLLCPCLVLTFSVGSTWGC